ncbi:ribosomal biogenesis factor [Monodelphis domestica]|uniref:Ribosomal biosis factor n=1 Tax=Monodelphis domestica TaxID=13616 RepID=F6TCB8_MONDO|nr:ribosomal biogenesis factor [Monodelphis domestica]XP_007486945.1 ribosomal biogenesis factor [Monodelphis domestica]
MGKNKGKGQKIKNVFHLASKNLKAKNKAKPVTTNLKKINIVNEDKVRTASKVFIDIQKELAHFSKRLSLEPLPRHTISQHSEGETISVDDATRLMAQL